MNATRRTALVSLLGLGLSALAFVIPTQIAACKPKSAAPAAGAPGKTAAPPPAQSGAAPPPAQSGAAPPPAQSGATPPPAGLSGVWDVVQVAVDSRDQSHWLYRPDDPRLLGRELQVDPERVHFNFGRYDCKPASWKTHSTSWGQLFGESFRRPERHDTPRSPAPSDFGSKLASSAQVAIYSLKCLPVQARPDPWAGAWFALQGRDSLAMSVSSSALLVLARRPSDAKPRASFDCAQAATPTEKTLCSQTGLAGFDRSVDAAWSGALERQPGEWARLHDEQRAWLVTRDRCGTDAACLEDQMLQRIEQLVQE